MEKADRNKQSRNIPFYYFRIALALSVLLFIISLGGFNIITDENIRLIFSDIYSLAINALVTFSIFLIARRSLKIASKDGMAWVFLGIAQLAYTVGDVIWAILELWFNISPYPSIADFFFLVYYPLFLIGIFMFPTNRNEYFAQNWYKQLLDIIVIIIAASLIFWNYILGPLIIVNQGASFWLQALSLAYPIGDLVLIGAILLILFRPQDRDHVIEIGFILLSILIVVITDSAFSIQSLTETYIDGSLVDMGWIVSNLIIGLAAIWALDALKQNRPKEPSRFRQVSNSLNSFSLIFPYVWLAGVLGMLLHSMFYPLPMPSSQITIWMIVILILTLARNFITRLENRILIVQIENALTQTQQQTRDLQNEINNRKRLEYQVLHNLSHNELTGLPNRVRLLEMLDRAIEATRFQTNGKYAVIFLNIDDFGHINDSLGPITGDQLLIAVGQRLKKHAHPDDTLIHLGRDDFMILNEGKAGSDEAITYAAQLQSAITKPFLIDQQEVRITASAGIVTSIDGYDSPLDILRDADSALNHAKLTGKCGIEVFQPKLRDKILERSALENELRHAVESCEFQLYYQPILSLTDETIVSFEALIRWNNPIKGLIPPDKFIPLAEETGIILDMGAWVIREACNQLKKWHIRYPQNNQLSVHINISRKQLLQVDFIALFGEILASTGVSPDCIKLEITESVFMENQTIIQNVFTTLRGFGVHLQIDDFGTGYSSLSYLRHIPVDVIKIDRSFVKEIGHDEKAIELIRTMISMARNLNCQTVAEGIETKEQLTLLKGLSCDFGQGYYFSRPVDNRSAEEMITKGLTP